MSAAQGGPKRANASRGLRTAAPGLLAQGGTVRNAYDAGIGMSSEDLSTPSVGDRS